MNCGTAQLMSGTCDECIREKECKKTIGIMFGYCNTEFIPKVDFSKVNPNAEDEMSDETSA